MSKLISLVHPYEIDEIKSVKTFFSFSKNIFKLIETKGCYEKVNGILIPVRWSKDKKTCVVDRGTSLYRDIEGIDLNNAERYFKSNPAMYNAVVYTLNTVSGLSNFNIVLDKFGLVKNEKKFIAFEYTCEDIEKIYFLGLYKRHNNNRDKLLIKKENNSTLIDKTLFEESIKKVDENKIDYLDCLKYNKKYNETYTQFLSFLNNQELLLSIFEDPVKSIENLSFKSKIKYRKIINVIQEKDTEFLKSNIESVLKTILTVYLGDFIKKILLLESSEGFVIYDSVLNKNIKITGSYILKNKVSFKKNLSDNNIDYNGICLFPKVF